MRSPFLTLLVSVIAPLARAEDVAVLEVYQRPAEDLVPAVRLLVEPQGSVAALGNKLVVKAPAQVLPSVRRAVRELDVAPRSLWISVKQTAAGRSADRHAQGAVRVGGEGGGIVVGGSGGTVVVHGSGGTTTTTRTTASGAFGASSASGMEIDVQRIRALEGRPAAIRTGVAVAVPQLVVVPGSAPGAAPDVVAGSSLEEYATGFEVLPHLAGTRVELELFVQRDRARDGSAPQVQRLSTTVSASLGEWVDVGSAVSDLRHKAHGILATGTREAEDSRSVLVRVELAD